MEATSTHSIVALVYARGGGDGYLYQDRPLPEPDEPAVRRRTEMRGYSVDIWHAAATDITTRLPWLGSFEELGGAAMLPAASMELLGEERRNFQSTRLRSRQKYRVDPKTYEDELNQQQ